MSASKFLQWTTNYSQERSQERSFTKPAPCLFIIIYSMMSGCVHHRNCGCVNFRGRHFHELSCYVVKMCGICVVLYQNTCQNVSSCCYRNFITILQLFFFSACGLVPTSVLKTLALGCTGVVTVE